MGALKQLMQGDRINPKSPLAPNARPVQPVNARTVRTNIYFQTAKSSAEGPAGEEEECPDIFQDFKYESAAFNSASSPGP